LVTAGKKAGSRRRRNMADGWEHSNTRRCVIVRDMTPLKLRVRLPFYSATQMDSFIRSHDPRWIGIANAVPLDDPPDEQAVHSGRFAQAAPCNHWS
jgi:hypothetical protein